MQITPLEDNSNIAELVNYINNAAENASIVFNGTAEDFNKAIADQSIDADVNAAIQCNDGNILYGNAKAPNDKPVIVADVKALDASIDGYKLLKNIDSNYNLLVLASSNGSNYVITIENDKAAAEPISKDNPLSKYADDKASLWKVTEGKSNVDGKLYYTFTNQNGVVLEAIDDAGTGTQDGEFYPYNEGAKYNNGIVLAVNDVDLGEGTPAYFGLYEAGKNVLKVENLNYFEQDGFSVTIKYQDADGKFTKEDIAGNEFVGHLTPMKWDTSKKEFVEFTKKEAKTADKFYLKNADGEYIVAELKADHKTEQVYTFTTVSEETLEHQLARGGDEQTYFGEFKAYTSASNQTALTELKAIDKLTVLVANDAEKVIGRWDYEKTPTLAASTTTALKEILISLGSDKIVDKTKFLQKGKFYTVECVASTNENAKRIGKKLVADALNDDNEGTWVESYGNVLEGQFALTVKDDNYIFTNRENGMGSEPAWIVPVNALYKTDKDNEYRYKNFTYKIDTVAGHKASDGYKTLPDVKNNKFYIGYASGVFDGNAWFVENHEGDKNHVIGLSTAQDDALIFTAKEYSAARQLKVEDKNHNYWYVPTDSIYVISELGYFDDDKKPQTTKDTLKIVSYTFVNQYTEPLKYNDDQENRLESDVYAKDAKKKRYENVEEAQKAAQHFALRIDGTKLNLRMVELTNEEPLSEAAYKNQGDGEKMFQTLSGEYKLSAGDTGDGIVTKINYLNREENDLFVVEPTEKPMYRTVINPLDTISIFRDDNSQSVLFEHNTFLGMENLSQYPEIAKAMIADTAYVRNNTYRPQYMLVVGADITPAGKWCPIHGDDPTCPDAHKVETSGWVEGRYLVNLVDTAIAWDAANKHKDNNPYINSEKYYRLGFVQAKHINDSLVIASTNDTLYVGSEDYNQAKFAFRYVDQEAGSFVIETANYNRLPGVEEAEINEDAPLGYLKWMNGVVVVVDDINNADVYNMNENETDTPTANEDIAVEEGVQVIAGNGAVTIQGAAGKTVVIANILGKAVANTTLTSDNQTINVPAGIVVVTVDGEAVKAIVK